MPKLWNETIETHKHAVREAILETTSRLVGEYGLTSVTMSQIAKETGIGRATLYKYFPDVEAILSAWHQRRIAEHLEHLTTLSRRSGDANQRLQAILEAYARICHQRRHGTSEVAALVHRGDDVAHAQQHLIDLIHDVLIDVADEGHLRQDVAPAELATYCVHALAAAAALPSEAAVRRLVKITLSGLRAPAGA